MAIVVSSFTQYTTQTPLSTLTSHSVAGLTRVNTRAHRELVASRLHSVSDILGVRQAENLGCFVDMILNATIEHDTSVGPPKWFRKALSGEEDV